MALFEKNTNILNTVLNLKKLQKVALEYGKLFLTK
jgi:hypothetical protein